MKTILSIPVFALSVPLFVGKAAEQKPNIIFILADDLGWSP